jgi:hypothetical protein
MPSSEYDLVYFRAGVQVLQEYLLSSEIYWAIGVSPPKGEQPYPQLTLGGLLLARARLMARTLPPDVQSELDSLDATLISIQNQWQVAFGKKAWREYRSRLGLWRDFIEEYRANPENHFDRYVYEVTRRVFLQLLQDYSVDLQNNQLELLRGLDKFLRVVLIDGEFIWEKELTNGFPRQVYWYLYGTLSPRKNP